MTDRELHSEVLGVRRPRLWVFLLITAGIVAGLLIGFLTFRTR